LFKNSYYDTKTSTIHLWEQLDGNDLYTKIEWVPYVYVPAKRKQPTAHTIYGKSVVKKEFKNYYEYYKFQKEDSNIYENRVRPDIQFLAERYYDIPDDEISVPNLTVYYLDIEVIPDKGFPDTLKPKDPVVLASIRNNKNHKTITFGTKQYNGNMNNLIFVYCKTEKDLLRKLFMYIHKHPCDVLSGWNIWSFDLPYLIHRSKKLFGKNAPYNLISPIGIVKTWKQRNSEEINIDIAGTAILDYYNVYRWYTPKNLENYTLQYVCENELGVGKLENKFDSFREWYLKDWDSFTEYNAFDCIRVNELEDKLGYIKLIQALSLLSKAPTKYYNAMTQLIEGAMLTYYRRNNFCAPHFAGGNQETFEAAYVKEPITGLHPWVVDLDITSSYPSHMITLNMSSETYFGRILGIRESDVVYYTKNREFPKFDMYKEEKGMVSFEGQKLEKFNKALKKGLITIAPCGSVFTTSETGVIAQVERNVFFKRKEIKDKMNKMRKEASKMVDGKEKSQKIERAQELYSLQWALKIWLNAVFGILAVPYSRYFNTNIAEAITSCGRHTIKQGEKFVDDYFEKLKIKGLRKNMTAYIDTDSLFITLGEYFEKVDEKWKSRSSKEKIEKIINFSKNTLEPYVNKRTYEETQLLDYNSQVKDFKIEFKQEIISRSALFIKKKKYAYWKVNEEGNPVNEISVTGLEIIRSDSSQAIRPRLRHIMEMIIKQKPEKEITSMIKKYRKELKELSPGELAANIGINNIQKYLGSGKPIKGTPWHVKGVYNYRILLKMLKIEHLYENIHEGIKSKVAYVKRNPFNIETITFQEWPKEFDEIVQFDKDIMIDKFFIKKIQTLLKPIDKEYIIEGNIQEKLGAFFN
jgi:DNA polymerase elongation subunit (family B)